MIANPHPTRRSTTKTVRIERSAEAVFAYLPRVRVDCCDKPGNDEEK